MIKKYEIDGSQPFDLQTLPTGCSHLCLDKTVIKAKTKENQLKMQALMERLFAQQKEGLILLLQARDAAGKDGIIKHVISGINPHCVDVYSFKTPTKQELAHDFLWRFNQSLPLRGKIAIFNRSYYEDVLIVKVRRLYEGYNVPDRMKQPDLIDKRYEQIRNYESYLYENGYRIIKVCLNVSKKEQKKRFLQRIEQPDKNWKFSGSDIAERKLWDEYTAAYQMAIEKTATPENPWYIIPADEKWFARYLVSELMLHVLQSIDPTFPVLSSEEQQKLEEYKEELEAESN